MRIALLIIGTVPERDKVGGVETQPRGKLPASRECIDPFQTEPLSFRSTVLPNPRFS